ncbi:MAG: hypothetical protein HYY44_02720 [Deltaproteobacteria bacterium]|nr:hypothetical protein [Deltaproteobacteria bacterium]
MGKFKNILLFFSLLASVASRTLFALDAGYDRGFYLLSDDKNYQFKFNIQVQPRHEWVSKEAALDENTFKLSRMKTYFSGHSFSDKYRYSLSIDFANGAGISEGYVDITLTDYLKILAGRYYILINREDVFAATGTQLIGYSIVSDHFGVNEDYGVQVYGNIIDPLAYYVFVGNGGGMTPADAGKNLNKELLVGSRLEYTISGEQFSHQGDPEISRSPNSGIAATLLYDFGADQETEDFEDLIARQIDPREVKLLRGDIDGGFSWYGFSFIGQWQYAYNTRVRSLDHGLMGQTGFYIIPRRLEIAGRWSSVFPDFPFPALAQTGITSSEVELGSGMPVHESVAGLNGYFKGHDLKVQIDYSQILNVGGVRNINDQRVRTQFTFVF